MKITITDVEKDDKQSRWVISWTETDNEGNEKPVKLAMPLDMLEWRAAEYNIDPSDMNTLIDIAVCETYVPQAFYESPEGLFNAPDITTAREAYLKQIAKVKLDYRVSTRAKGSPLELIKSTHTHDSARMAYKGLNTLLIRHEIGAQELDPAVHSVLLRFREAAQFGGN